MVFRELRNGEFFFVKDKSVLCFITFFFYRSATKIVYDPDIDTDAATQEDNMPPLTSSETLLVNALTNLLRESTY